MAERIIVSGGGKLRTFALPDLMPGREAPLPGCGALCVGQGSVYVSSDEERAVYHLDADTLLPRGVFSGGPGVRALCLSAGGERLYALLGDADSVLMLCAHTGAPLLLARVGVNPQNMRLDDAGERLVIAGGKDGCAYVLCAHTLRMLACCASDGFCMDAGLRNGRVRALRCCGERGFAAGKWIASGDAKLLLDRMSGRLYLADRADGTWRFVCSGVRDAALTG